MRVVSVKHLHAEWRKKVAKGNESSSWILSICGPSGTGKTTLVKALAKSTPAFVETTRGNANLGLMLRGTPEFDAVSSQRWFLRRIRSCILEANPHLPLVLDQDPAAIQLVYSQMLLDQGKIRHVEYASIFERLMEIEQLLQRWRSPRIILSLDAPAKVLRERVAKRQGKARTPPVEWFETLRGYFARLLPCFPDVVSVSTVELSPAEVASRARALIEERQAGAQG